MVTFTSFLITFFDIFITVAEVLLGIFSVAIVLGIFSFLFENLNVVIIALSILEVLVILFYVAKNWILKIIKPMILHRQYVKGQHRAIKAKHRRDEKSWYDFITVMVVAKRKEKLLF